MTVGEVTYMVLDLLKGISDDFTYTEEHVIFLMKKYRSFLLKKEQDKENSSTDVASEFEYQQICLSLEKVAAIDGEPCTGGYYLRTTDAIPKVLDGTQPKAFPTDYYQGINIVYVPRERMRYVGTNRFLQNIIYVSLGPDLHLYLKSSNPQFFYLAGDNKLRVSAIFEDFDEAADLLCDDSGEDTSCDILDAEFPMRSYLVPTLIELVLKELSGGIYKPRDGVNSASDDLSDLVTFIRRNMKTSLQKQIEE